MPRLDQTPQQQPEPAQEPKQPEMQVAEVEITLSLLNQKLNYLIAAVDELRKK